MTLFEYRKVEDSTKCLFICLNKKQKWTKIINLPYKFNDDFWWLEQDDIIVLNKSLKIAKDNNAPKWVYK